DADRTDHLDELRRRDHHRHAVSRLAGTPFFLHPVLLHRSSLSRWPRDVCRGTLRIPRPTPCHCERSEAISSQATPRGSPRDCFVSPPPRNDKFLPRSPRDCFVSPPPRNY